MPPTKQSKKAAAVPHVDPPAKQPLAEWIDELGALEAEIAPLNPKMARVEVLRRAIRDSAADCPAAETILASGDRYCVLIGAKALQQVVNIPKLFKLVGGPQLARICTVTLKALAAVPSRVALDVTTAAYTGPRSLKVMERGKAA